jgi:hypothetical protein
MRKTLWVLCSVLVLSAVILSGCETTEEGATFSPATANEEPTETQPAPPKKSPTVPPADAPKDLLNPAGGSNNEPNPALARDAALATIRDDYPGIAPATDLTWAEQMQNAPAGSSTILYTSQPGAGEDSWVVTVSFPIGPSQETTYLVMAYNPASGFDLQVEVDAVGEVMEQEIELGARLGGQGISLSYSTNGIAAEVVRETIPGVESPAGWESTPEHVQLTFTGYILPETFHDPRLMIYPVGDFEASSEIAANIISDLRRMLEEKPAEADAIPFLPAFNAAQMMGVQMKYLDFQTGSGVRYLTQYGQAFFPINNHNMFYTFQGLTQDGEYYVAAILPVSHPDLPADGRQVPGGDQEAFANDYERYVAGIEQLLDMQDLSSFTPNLSLLDAMIHSLQVSPPAQAMYVNTDGGFAFRDATTWSLEERSEDRILSGWSAKPVAVNSEVDQILESSEYIRTD